MPEYEAGIIVEGCLRMRLQARNRQEAQRLIRTAKVRLVLLDDRLSPIGEVMEGGLYDVRSDDIEVHRPEDEISYHDPVSQADVDLS